MATPAVEDTIELDPAALTAISTSVKDALMADPKLSDAMKEAAANTSNERYEELLKKFDALTKVKQTNDPTDDDADGEDAGSQMIRSGIESGEFKTIAKESKKIRFAKQLVAMKNGNREVLNRYNRYNHALRLKAGYGDETVNQDGGYLVPDPEFDLEVYSNLPKYGVAFQYANVRNTMRTAVYANTLDSGLVFSNVAEAGVIPGGKLNFSREVTHLQKYATIVPVTEELTEDAAVDYWAIVTTEVARAYAKKADEIMFTDPLYGIIKAGDVSVGHGPIFQPIAGGTGATVVWDDLLNAEAQPEEGLDQSKAAWFMRKETFARLRELKAAGGSGDYLFNGWAQGANFNEPRTPWGTPIVFTRVLTRSADLGASGALALFGDMSLYNLWNRTGLEVTMLNQATVKDSLGNDFNLATQDGIAMRVIVRMLGNLPGGNAQKLVVLGAGSIS